MFISFQLFTCSIEVLMTVKFFMKSFEFCYTLINDSVLIASAEAREPLCPQNDLFLLFILYCYCIVSYAFSLLPSANTSNLRQHILSVSPNITQTFCGGIPDSEKEIKRNQPVDCCGCFPFSVCCFCLY